MWDGFEWFFDDFCKVTSEYFAWSVGTDRSYVHVASFNLISAKYLEVKRAVLYQNYFQIDFS